jgi:threonine dehydratase
MHPTVEERVILMDWPTPTLADVLKARTALAPHLRPTPTLERAELDAALGCRAYLKCENLNPTGAFKVRGGVYLVSTLSPEQRARGVLAASTGNHAQSVAYAARLFGARAIIYMPEAANPLKVAATRALGAEVVLIGRDFDAARQGAEALAEQEGLRYIHSANEPLLIAAVATCALELFEVAPDLDVLFVPVGAGSGVIGAAVVARAINPSTRIIGVQAEGAPAVYRSWKAGRRIVTEAAATFAEGLATREPFDLPLQLLPRLVDEMMLVSDGELKVAMRLLLETTNQVAEGAGAAAVAAALHRRAELHDRRVGLILSGGNIALEQLRDILNEGRATPEVARRSASGEE